MDSREPPVMFTVVDVIVVSILTISSYLHLALHVAMVLYAQEEMLLVIFFSFFYLIDIRSAQFILTQSSPFSYSIILRLRTKTDKNLIAIIVVLPDVIM